MAIRRFVLCGAKQGDKKASAHPLRDESLDAKVACTHLQRHNRILHVQARIDRQRLRDNQQRIRKRLHAKLRAALGFVLLDVLDEVSVRGDLECACARDEGRVFEGVLDCAQAVADRVGDLRDGVCVGTCVRWSRTTISSVSLMQDLVDQASAQPTHP